MPLTEQDAAFVDRRRKLVQSWPVAGGLCAVVLLGLGVWMWLTRPLLINPWATLRALETSSIPDSTVVLMAGLLPVVVLTCLLLVLAFLVLSFVAFANERRHLAIIDRTLETTPSSRSAP
jgi:hypothetical protein